MNPVVKQDKKQSANMTHPNGTVQRIVPKELSHEILDTKTVRTRYKAGYCNFTVVSSFSGDKPLLDAFYEILHQRQK